MSRDFAEMLLALPAEGAEFLLVGVQPQRVDLLTSIDGVSFEEAAMRAITP